MTPRRALDVLWLLVMAATLAAVIVMAFTSAYNAHPDEKDHIGAGQYYMEYWDPPRIGDPRALGAYSNYGVSYLNQLDAVYFLAGKFARMVKPLVGQDYLALRLFNVSLLALVMVLFWRLPRKYRIASLPFFISPQAWYVFSYFNGDALPLALSFISAYFLSSIIEDSNPAQLRFSDPQSKRLAGLGLTLGLLAISKQNYYVYLVYFACLWLSMYWLDRAQVVTLRRVGLAFALAAAIFGVRYGVYVWSVRHQPPDAEASVAEQLATEDLKPSKQEKGGGFWGAQMRSKGVTLTEMFTGEWKWHVFTFRSSFGKYGVMDIEAPLIFYRYIGWMFWAFLGLMLAPLLWAGPSGRVMAGIFLFFACLTVFQSLWHSWTADFQAQGRYLFPLLGMMACLLARFQHVLGRFREMLWAVGLGMWGMSIWSFLTVGLARIAR